MDNELKPEEVKEILNKVCRRKTFSSVQPLYINGKWRLAAQGLETAHYYNKFKNNNKDNPSSFVVISLPNHDDLEFTTLKENKAANLTRVSSPVKFLSFKLLQTSRASILFGTLQYDC